MPWFACQSSRNGRGCRRSIAHRCIHDCHRASSQRFPLPAAVWKENNLKVTSVCILGRTTRCRSHHFATYPVVAQVPGAGVIFNIVFFITIVSLIIQGTTVSWVARLFGLSTPMEKTGNDFGVELPEEIDSDLRDVTVTQEILERGDTLKDMNLPKGTLVMIVKRGDEYLIPNGTLKLHVGDKLLLISEKTK